MSDNARDIYLSSLDAKSDLNARRLAELAHIPADDPMWLLMHETQRSVREVINGADAVLANGPFAQRLATAVAGSISHNERITATLTAAIERTREGGTQAIRSLPWFRCWNLGGLQSGRHNRTATVRHVTWWRSGRATPAIRQSRPRSTVNRVQSKQTPVRGSEEAWMPVRRWWAANAIGWRACWVGLRRLPS